MKLELQSASNFLVHLIRRGRRNIGENRLEKFRQSLVEALQRRYRDHWFPEKPFKGSGYRGIRINGKMDPVIERAAEACAFSSQLICSVFPSELTIWIDPQEVSYRVGKNGSICVLYKFKEGCSEPWRPSAKASLSSSSNNKTTTTLAKKFATLTTATNNGKSTSNSSSFLTVTTSCKESLRKTDYILDPRKSVSAEQLAAYVSSS